MTALLSDIPIPANEIQLDFVRSSGPGGQNVNKVSSAVQLRFDVRNSPSLKAEIKERLVKLAGSRMTDEGILIIEARRFRTQEQNREDAIQRLVILIRQAAEPPRARRRTRPTLASQVRRVEKKKQRGAIKRGRRAPARDME